MRCAKQESVPQSQSKPPAPVCSLLSECSRAGVALVLLGWWIWLTLGAVPSSLSLVVMTLTWLPQVLWDVRVNHRKCLKLAHCLISRNIMEICGLIEQSCAHENGGKLFYSSRCCLHSRTSFHFLRNDLAQCPLTVAVLGYSSSVQHIIHAVRIPLHAQIKDVAFN